MLELRDLSFSVRKDHKKNAILREISFSIKNGELVVITGPNGSGKSTLAKIISGIETPDSGQIILGRKNITNLDCTERARIGIVYSFQQPVRFKGVTVNDLLQISATGGEAFIKKKSVKVDKYLRAVGLAPQDYLNREIDSSLSGGEIKRIEIASVLARKAKLIVFDEPEAGIDIWSFNNLIKVFKDIRKNNPKCMIIIISHQERIMKMADKIIVLKNGKIIMQGSSEKILKQMEPAR